MKDRSGQWIDCSDLREFCLHQRDAEILVVAPLLIGNARLQDCSGSTLVPSQMPFVDVDARVVLCRWWPPLVDSRCIAHVHPLLRDRGCQSQDFSLAIGAEILEKLCPITREIPCFCRCVSHMSLAALANVKVLNEDDVHEEVGSEMLLTKWRTWIAPRLISGK